MNPVTIGIALNFLTNLLANAGQLSTLIAQAKSQGREELTTDEWAQITGGRDAAIAKLDADIAAGST